MLEKPNLLERMGFNEKEILELEEHCGPYAVDVGLAVMAFRAKEIIERIKLSCLSAPSAKS